MLTTFIHHGVMPKVTTEDLHALLESYEVTHRSSCLLWLFLHLQQHFKIQVENRGYCIVCIHKRHRPMQKYVTAQSQNPPAIIRRQFSPCGQRPMFQRFQFSQQTSSSVFWSLFTVQLAIWDRIMELEMEFQLISIKRYLHMNANTFKKAHKKVN